MSRDWCPAELFIADRAVKRERGYSLRETEFSLVNAENGAQTPLTNKQARADYPELSFLYGGFDRLYEEYSDNKAMRAVFDRFEKALIEAEKVLETEVPLSKELYLMDEREFLTQSVETVVQEWFLGRLDSNFYYNECNNAAFRVFLASEMDKAKERTILYEGNELYKDCQYCCRAKEVNEFSVFANVIGEGDNDKLIVERFQRYGKLKLNDVAIPRKEFEDYYEDISEKKLVVFNITNTVENILTEIEEGKNQNSYGEAQSGYYVLVNAGEADVCVSVTKEEEGLDEKEFSYSVHLVDEINQENGENYCEVYSCPLDKEALISLLEEIRETCIKEFDNAEKDTKLSNKKENNYDTR